jgi:hypothetical protein
VNGFNTQIEINHHTILQFWHTDLSKFDSPDWRREDWLIRSALVPIDKLNEAAANIPSPHDLVFEIGWDDDKFGFGDHTKYANIPLYPLSQLRKHPISRDYTVELSREFLTYHALQVRNQTQYYHPIDNILVAQTNLESHEIYDRTAYTFIHRDYLRDFLSSLDMGLLICVAADRFANAHEKDKLDLDQIENEQIDEFTWLSTIIHSPEFTRHRYFRGRAILHRNFIITPYDKPKFDRNPWLYYGEKLNSEDEFPRFIVNDEGDKKALSKTTSVGNFGYLYFRSEVLFKYLQNPGYSVFFHMRNWGVASLPGNRGTIDVGINSQGLVNAFAPDLADLNLAEQSYWASFSSLPSGEVCEEMFETRMQQNPPFSPGVTELISNARSQLNDVFQNIFSIDLYNDMDPRKQELCRLSVGPISNQYSEVLELAKILYGWVIETMRIDSLRSALKNVVGKVDKKLREIKLLEKILITRGVDETQAREMTSALVGLNELRIGSAHIGSLELEPCFQLLGATKVPDTPRAGWNFCVDAIASCLTSIESVIQT